MPTQRISTRRGNSLDVTVIPGARNSAGRPPLLLVHPINMRKECWLEVAAAAVAERTCILVDLAGHGGSSDDDDFSLQAWVDDCSDVVSVLGLSRVHIAGGSLGGGIALGVAIKMPGTVVSVAGFGSAVAPVPTEVAAPPAPATEAEVDELFAQLSREAAAPSASEQVIERIRLLTNDHGPEVVAKVLQAAYSADARPWLERIECPALWVVGEFDVTCTPEENERIATILGGEHCTLADTGHIPMVERTDLVIEVLLPHLARADELADESRAMKHSDLERYRTLHRRSLDDPDGFWMDAADAIEWITPPERALEMNSDGSWTWFPGGVLNTSANALDRHVAAGRGNHPAVIYHSAMTGERRTVDYRELLDRVSVFAGALRRLGVEKGDRVVIFMPMIPEAVVAMLACARLGAIHSVVFGGFAAAELASRLSDAQPKVVVTSSGGLEPGRSIEYLPLVSRALEISGCEVAAVVVATRPQIPGAAIGYSGPGDVRWIDWQDAVAGAQPAEPVPVAANDPLYILYTSGTTGFPKGVVRDNGGHAVALAWSIPNVYGLPEGGVYWAASDVGWVVGSSYIVYAPLLAGATTVLYEGKPVGTPDAGEYWRVVEEHGVDVLFTAPTAARAIRRVDPELRLLAGHDISSLRAVFLAGERLDPETFDWLRAGLARPIVDHWWQTETGWPISAIPRGLIDVPGKPGSANLPMPGYAVHIVDRQGTRIAEPGVEGNIAIRTPLAPGNLLGIWGAPDRLRESYLSAFDGYYITGDSGSVDDDGYLFVMGRTDDVINVAGHRLSTGALEETLLRHEAVAECAVVGIADELKGQRPMGFVVVKVGVSTEHDTVARELIQLVRDTIGPVASFREVTIVERLPKTRSGKILRKAIRQLVDGEQVVVPATIEDASVIDELRCLLSSSASGARD